MPTAPNFPPFILASASPRRRQLLAEAGYRIRIVVGTAEEPEPEGFSSAAAYATHTAWLKAASVAAKEPGGPWIMAADTVAAVNGLILGKAAERADARRILSLLAGTKHEVLTGVCLYLPKRRFCLMASESTQVAMKALTPAELEAYLDSGLWEGKAGAYGIQDEGDPFVEAVEGSYTNVVGLPMERVAELLCAAQAIEAFSPP